MARRKPAAPRKPAANEPSAKTTDLGHNTVDDTDALLTTNHGVRINDDMNSLKAGERGPTLLEDFILREKITHFDHERIPERVVHARGVAAHGVFRPYKSMKRLTRAAFLQDPAVETPVFARFSTVVGSRGSTDLPRDVRGFSVKFYTEEGNFDLVGNNMPVFFIQDAVKFPDLVHSIKPEPHREIPQASAAHDTFWDFVSVTPESMHTIMWAMSDRAIPRSLRMMEGFGVHTFRLVNAAGESRFIKWHWKPILGVHGVTWNEAQKISGFDPDFHRRDLWDAIDQGHFPEWELGVQVVDEKDEFAFDFDLLDPTKLIPEELVPVQRIGRMTLNRNPDNYFAETEQVAFHPGHIVPGIDFSNDPLLAGRLFSYTDTQLLRLGGPNFHEIPINRPVAPVHNNQRDGLMRQTINRGKVAYGPNTLANGCPYQSGAREGGFTSFPERIDDHKVRARSSSFFDHFTQARMFFRSQAPHEQRHMIDALKFELGMVESVAIRERMLFALAQIDRALVKPVADHLGLKIPASIDPPHNLHVPADEDVGDFQPRAARRQVELSPALSMAVTKPGSIETRQVAVLASDGFDGAALANMKKALTAAGAMAKIVAPHLGEIKPASGQAVTVDFAFHNTASVLFDAVYVAGGKQSTGMLLKEPAAIHFVNEAFKHCKPIAASGEGSQLLEASSIPMDDGEIPGVILGDGTESVNAFIAAMGRHRFWEREENDSIPA